MPLSSSLAMALLDWAFGSNPVPRPGSPVLALFTGPYGNIGSAEPAPATGYERRGLTFGTSVPAAGGATAANSLMASFPQALTDWPELTHWAVFNSASSALMAWGELPHAIKVYAGETLDVPAGGIVMGIGACPS